MEKTKTLTVKELQARLIELGMPKEDAETFKTKAPMIASIRSLEAKEEVKKVASIEEKPSPSEDREVNKRWKSKAAAMRDRLALQPKVSILIPLAPTEKQGQVEVRTDKEGNEYQVHVSGAVESVQLNGYKYFIPKGRYTPVPQQIAEVISKSQQQTLNAGNDIKLDRIKDGRPVRDSL